MPKPDLKKIVVVTTKPEPWHDGPKQPTPALKEIWDAADELRDDDDRRAKLLFQPPAFRPIETPIEIFDTYNKQQKFIVACHEVGHALASMMVCRPTQCLTVTELNGSIRGGANTTDAHGENAAIVDLGGIAAEQLVIGSGDCHAGADTDIKNAHQNLRDDRVPESMINSVMQAIHHELQETFERDWLPGIIYTSTKLAQVGVLDWEGFVELMAQGQRRAFQAGSLQKVANLLGTHETLRKSIQRISNRPKLSELDLLAQELREELGADRLIKSAEPASEPAVQHNVQPGATEAYWQARAAKLEKVA